MVSVKDNRSVKMYEVNMKPNKILIGLELLGSFDNQDLKRLPTPPCRTELVSLGPLNGLSST